MSESANLSLAASPLVESTPWQVVLSAYLNAALDSPATVRAYRRQCTLACQRMGIVSLADLNGATLAAYRAEVINNPDLGPASQAQSLYALRGFLGWAGLLGAHRLNEQVIRASLRAPRATVRNPYQILKGDETARLWQAASRRPVTYALVCVCLGAGLRVSEIAALRVQDLYADLEGGPAIRVYQGKGGKDRICPMTPDYFAGITNYLASTGRDLTSPGRVFVADDRARQSRGKGAGISSTGLYLMLRSVLVDAGIDTRRRGVHALRHQFAIGVLRESKNLVVVQKLLGHSNIATTSRYVDHLELGELRDALPQGGPSVAPPPANAPQDGLSSVEAAAILGVTVDWTRELWHRGELAAIRRGHDLRFDPATVEAYRVSRGLSVSRGTGSRAGD